MKNKVLLGLALVLAFAAGTVAQDQAQYFYKSVEIHASGARLWLGKSVTLMFEGATTDSYQTTVTVADPTAARTVTFRDASGTVDLDTYENVTATNVITADETGSTYVLNSATEFVSTLPLPAAGLHFTFIVGAAPSGASYTVVTSASANIMKGLQNSVAGDAGDSGTADDTASFIDGQAVAGDKIEFYSDGTSWFAYGISKVAAGVTFTQAS